MPLRRSKSWYRSHKKPKKREIKDIADIDAIYQNEKPMTSKRAEKRSKSQKLRKKSTNWIKFSNSLDMISKRDTIPKATTSICRPGTLYSDIVMQGSLYKSEQLLKPCSLHIKNSSKTISNMEQYKFLKALEKHCKMSQSMVDICHTKSDELLYCCSDQNDANDERAKNENLTFDSHLSKESSSQSLNGPEQSMGQLNLKLPFMIDIPKWNFTSVDLSPNAYPKFMCQFDDDNYLKAERFALAGLKLALGDRPQHQDTLIMIRWPWPFTNYADTKKQVLTHVVSSTLI